MRWRPRRATPGWRSFRPPEAAHEAPRRGACACAWNLPRMHFTLRILKRRGTPARCAAAPCREKTGPCSGSHCIFPPCRRRRSSRSRAWACQFTPKVSLEPPQALLLEVEGSLRLFGGVARSSTATAIRPRRTWASTRRSPPPPTPRAALWRARGGGLPRIEDAARRSGMRDETREFLPQHRRGDASASCSRCRATGSRSAAVRRLARRARSRARPRCPSRARSSRRRSALPPRLELPAPRSSHAEALLFAARRLLVQLEGLLAARQAGVRALHARPAGTADGRGERASASSLASPARDAERLARAAAREAFARLQLAQPVEAIARRSGRFRSPRRRTAAGMFGDAAAEAEDWARLARAPAGAPGPRRRARPRRAPRSSPRARLAARRAGRMGSARIRAAGAAARVAAWTKPSR